MRFKIVIFLFGLIFLVGYSEEIGNRKVKILEQKISAKEVELEELKVLYQDLLEKNEKMETSPKIGLVLSGGGAKGVAHVGVLKMLEEYNIHIDYITGTSFGSIVGALYAAGYTADEIETIILNIDWDSFKNDNQARKHSSFKSKAEKEKYILNLGKDEDSNLILPKGVLTGEAFYLELKSLFMRVEGIDDFDDLKIPFRAVSTNINTGERYVAGEGDLAKAVFMSMAIPTVLDPVEHNGEYYVDGGLIENLPVREVIEMGADIVIAVDISADSNIIEDNSNIFQILEKMTTYKSKVQFEKAKELADILIVPDVKDHSIADFTGLESLVKKGVDETKQYREELVKLGSNKGKSKQNLKSANDKEIKVKINEVMLIGNKSLTLDKVLAISGKGIPEEYTVEEMTLWMNKLEAIDIINRFFYVIEDEKLIINVKENEDNHLRLGFNYSHDFGAALRIGRDIQNYGLFDNDSMIMAEISKYPKIEFENITDYRFKEAQYLGIVNLGLTTDPLFIYDKDDKISDYNNYKLYISGGLGTVLFNSYLVATKFYYIGIKNEYTSGSKDFISSSSWEYVKNRTFITTDTRDQAYFSNGGANNRMELFSGGDIKGEGEGDVEFYGGLYDLHKYIPINEKFNVELFASGGKMNGGNVPENEYFKIGGLRSDEGTNQFSFYGMNAMRKHVDEFYMGGINLRYKFNRNIYINVKYNAVTYSDPKFSLAGEEGNLGESFKNGVGIGLGLDTIVGPLEFVASNDVDSDGMLFSLFLGYEF